MNLLGVPFVVIVERLARVGAGRLVELLVFGRPEPRAMNNLALGLVGRGEVGQMSESAVPDGGLEHLPQGHDRREWCCAPAACLEAAD
jgi:hypothetical protein